MDPADVEAALVTLGGVATRRELEQLVSRRHLRQAVTAGVIVPAGRGRFASVDLEAARLAASRVGGVASHLSAAQQWNWKVQFPPELPHVTVPRWRRVGDRAGGARVHWANLGPGERDGDRTSRLRTVADCARTLEFAPALCVADSALREGRITRRQLQAEIEGGPRPGRAAALRVVEAADGRAANPFESTLRAICLSVPGLSVTPQHRIAGIGRADLVDEALGLVIEAESWEFHGSEAGFARDIRRYTDMVRAGWTVVRFTWKEVMFEPERVAAVLADLVARGPDPRAVERPVRRRAA